MDRELIEAVARLDPKTILTFQVQAGELAKAMREVAGGPEWVTPGQAVKRFGRSAKYWRAKAEAREIHGAYKDCETDRWYLPRDACRTHLEAKARGTGTPPRAFRARGPRMGRRRPPP